MPRKAAKRSAKKASAKKKAAPAKRVGVGAYVASLPPWQREIAQKFDAIVAREVPGVRRAIKWGVPFYGLEGRGWFASVGGFSKHFKINFFRGTALKPVPPSGESKQMRSIDLLGAEEFDEKAIRDWVRQAAALPGWGS